MASEATVVEHGSTTILPPIWPELWFPNDPDQKQLALLALGTTSTFAPAPRYHPQPPTLPKSFCSRCGWVKEQDGTDLGVGSNPAMFVVHSMGDWWLRKPTSRDCTTTPTSTSSGAYPPLLFAQPHIAARTWPRHLNHASISPGSQEIRFRSRQNSPAIEKLNEQFRYISPTLSICSFYQTLQTTIGPTNIMVLEKDTPSPRLPNWNIQAFGCRSPLQGVLQTQAT